MKQTVRALCALAFLASTPLGPVAPAFAQDRVGPTLVERGAAVSDRGTGAGFTNAQSTRQQLQRLLNEHAPAVRAVLQADPSLLQGDYLAGYPALAAFVKEHPEVARDPAFFFGQHYNTPRTAEERALDTIENLVAGAAVFTVVLTALLLFGWIIRQVLHQRRWSRQWRIQTDMQTKILDRLQSSEDLLAYIQAPGSRHLLEGVPMPAEDPVRLPGSPHGRILWSAQIGVILVALGIGLRFAESNAALAIAPAFRTLGVLAIALGLGALLSGLASYVLSVRFGLMAKPNA